MTDAEVATAEDGKERGREYKLERSDGSLVYPPRNHPNHQHTRRSNPCSARVLVRADPNFPKTHVVEPNGPSSGGGIS